MIKIRSSRLATCASLLGLFCLVLWVCPASADTIDFVATSTYDSTTSMSPLSVPGSTFTFTFSEPDTLTSLDTNVAVTYTVAGCPTCSFSGTGEVQFFPQAQNGLFDIVVLNSVDSDTYLWSFFGPQIYSGSSAPFSLMPGTFNINDSSTPPPSTFDDSLGAGVYSGTFTAGTVVATSTAAAVPEPSLLLLLSAGLLGLGSMRRRSVSH